MKITALGRHYLFGTLLVETARRLRSEDHHTIPPCAGSENGLTAACRTGSSSHLHSATGARSPATGFIEGNSSFRGRVDQVPDIGNGSWQPLRERV
jgi:hypothetical protein